MSARSKITVEGAAYTVLDTLGFQHSAGVYVKEVETSDGPRMAVRYPGSKVWRWWTVADRVRPGGVMTGQGG